MRRVGWGLGPVGASSPPWHRQQDAFNNTYRALRVIDRRPGGLGNVMYAEFALGSFNFERIAFREYFDMDADPWQMHNRYSVLTTEEQQKWAKMTSGMFGCRGPSCRMQDGPESEL